MAERFDVVLVKFPEGPKVYAFEAPKYSGIKVGDEVIVDSLSKEKRGDVVGVRDFNMNYDDNEFEFMLTATGATTPLKRVIARLKREDMKYEEEKDE